jgi:hypothetical protein
VRPIEIELGDRRPGPFEDGRRGQAQVARCDVGDENGLVVAAFPGALGMDRDGHQEVTAGSGAAPAARHGPAERLSKPPFAAVLELVQRPPHRPRERGTPLELEERLGDVGRQAQRRTPGKAEPGIKRRLARSAQRRAFASAADAAGGQRQIECPVEEVPHGAIVAGAALRALTE